MNPLRPSALVACLLALGAGAAAALGFEPLNLWPLTILAVALLLALIDGSVTRRRAVLLGWLFGTAHFFTGLGWIATAFTFQAKMPPILGWLTVLLLSMFLALYIAIAAGLTRAFTHRPLPRILAFAAFWMLVEWLRGWVLSGFAWNPLGAAWLPAPGIAQLASIGGALGLSSLVILAAGGLWLLARPGQRLGGAVLVITVLAAAGAGLALPRTYSMPDYPLVYLVQPNIGQDVKYEPGIEEAHLQIYLDLTTNALAAAPTSRQGSLTDTLSTVPTITDFTATDKFAAPLPTDASEPVPTPATPAPSADTGPSISAQLAPRRRGAIILWSESAVPYAVEEDPAIRARLAAVLRRDDLLLFGGLAINRDNAGNVVSLTNSLFVLDATGKLQGRYDKAHLVPLGEYVPARALMTALGVARLAPGELDFIPGPGPQTLKLPGFLPVGVQICYEIIFPGAVVDAANRPAWIANISNDAWFGADGPPQHLAQARLRAIEEGLPIARATQTGISAMIDAYGRVIARIPTGIRGVESSPLPPAMPPTLFARYGHLIAGVIGLLLLAAALLLDRRTGR